MKRNRLLWIALIALVLLYIGAGLSRISFNIDILRLLPTHLRQVEGLSLFLKNFALPDELIVTLDAPDAETAKSSAEALAKALRNHPDLVKNAVAEAPWESNPAGLSEFLSFLLLNQPEKKILEIKERLSPSQAESTAESTLEELNTTVSPQQIAILGYDPYRLFSSLSQSSLVGSTQTSEFSSSDGKFRVLYIQSVKPFANYTQTAEWLKSIRKICTEANPDKKVALGFTGEPAFVAEISTGMQWDMISSALVTLALISLIFCLCYGEFSPLRWLIVMLHLIFLLSLATAGLFLKELTVVGAGFASVMIGLSVDYGYFIYQRSLHHSGSLRALQWHCLQNIVWTSGTTAAAFFALNLSSLPGLSQLGNMVGMGVCIGALVMLGIFAPISMRFAKKSTALPTSRLEPLVASPFFAKIGTSLSLGMILLLLGALLLKGFPESDFSASTFRPRNSNSQASLEKLYARLHDDRGFLSLIVTGKSADEVLARLRQVQSQIDQDLQKGMVKSFLSPLPLWPEATLQKSNLLTLDSLSSELPRLRETLLHSGFSPDAFALTSAVVHQAHTWNSSLLPVWPSGETSEWILRRMVCHHQDQFLALGIMEPTPGSEEALLKSIQGEGIYLVSWGTLGEELKRKLPREILHVALGLLAGIIVILLFALRSFRAVLLFTLTTALVLLCLAGAMSLFGMKWGFFNLAAVLLLLGTGTDYSILLLLAFKRNGGDAIAAQRELGVVIFLCCTSAAAGFASLAWASNMGLATLGKTCALGLLIDGMISLFLLPKACHLLLRKKTVSPTLHDSIP
jgi:predicted exporter